MKKFPMTTIGNRTRDLPTCNAVPQRTAPPGAPTTTNDPLIIKFIYAVNYTGCNRRNGPDFGRVFLMLNYTEKPQNTYIQS